MTFKKWREKGESLRVDRHRCIEGRCLYQIMSARTKVTKTKTELKQATYNPSDLKHAISDLQRVCRTWRLGLGLKVTNTIGSNNSKFATIAEMIALALSSSLLIWAPSFCSLSNVFFAWPSWS
jgi:hypothetical protein